MEVSNADIGRRIRELRKENGLTQEQLAERVDISVDFLGLVETGRSGMKTQTLAAIAKVLNITTDYLIFGTTAYEENPKINSLISAVPENKRKNVEKLITLFLSSLHSEED